MTAAEAKSGKYTYYICHSLLKRGKGACKTPRLNAKNFEKLIVNEIRENVLTESNIQRPGEAAGRGDGRGGPRPARAASEHRGGA